MEEREHHIQDACEAYAVALLQRLAEEQGRSITTSADERLADFKRYAEARGLRTSDFSEGRYSQYQKSVDRFIPQFLSRLLETWVGVSVDFIDIEKDYRILGRKGDFLIKRSDGSSTSVSLKNYRSDASSMQCNSGTFLSFVNNFLFEPDGVGMFLDPATSRRFRGSSAEERSAAYTAAGYEHILPFVDELDLLNQQIKERFVYSDDFEYLTGDRLLELNEARVNVGRAGLETCSQIIGMLPPELVKQRLLKMVGLDGAEETLLLFKNNHSDSITNPRFRRLRLLALEPETIVKIGSTGQSMMLDLYNADEELLRVRVPFTINKNGAWISDKSYGAGRIHPKEGVVLAYSQRRPKKSKELATSINTWVEFRRAGIFDWD